MDKLAAEVVDEAVRAGLGWERDGDELVKTYKASTFPAAIDFVVKVAEVAEAADHHPDIDIRWRTVVLRLTTHEVGGLSERDLELARKIDGLVSGRG